MKVTFFPLRKKNFKQFNCEEIEVLCKLNLKLQFKKQITSLELVRKSKAPK